MIKANPVVKNKIKYFLYMILNLIITNSVVISQSDDEKVNIINQKVEAINAAVDLKSVTLTNEEFMENMSDGGGELKAYYNRDKIIQKIIQRVIISYGIYVTDYYFENNRLIFASEGFEQFASDSLHNLDYSKTEITFRGMYYFDGSKIIQTNSVGHNRFEEDGSDPAEYYIKDSGKNILLVGKKLSEQ